MNTREHAQTLIKRAGNDLVAARVVFDTGEAFDTVCFHAQQAVEKSIKAILALNDIDYPYRHDLGELFALVEEFVPEISKYKDDIISLTPYAVAVRYDDFFTPTREDTSLALKTAEAVYTLIIGIL